MYITLENKDKITTIILEKFKEFYKTHPEWSIRKLALVIGLSRGAINDYLLDRYKPKIEHLLAIEDFLNKQNFLDKD